MKKLNLAVLMATLLALNLFTSCGDDKKDEPTPDVPTELPTFTDNDGNVYHYITIGTQTWMVENLKTTKYNDGTSIPNVTNGASWAALTTGAYCVYDNIAGNGTKYGNLYNWYAVNTGKLAPTGWHVPTDAEMTTLYNYVGANLGISPNAAKALSSTTDWTSETWPNVVGNDLTKNNSSGFTALPAGERYLDGVFRSMLLDGRFWTSSDYNTTTAKFKGLSYSSVSMGSLEINKKVGFSIRCVKN